MFTRFQMRFFLSTLLLNLLSIIVEARVSAESATIAGYYTHIVTNIEDGRTYQGRENFSIQLSGRNSIDVKSSIAARYGNGSNPARQRSKLGHVSGGWHVSAGNTLTKIIGKGTFLLTISIRGNHCDVVIKKTQPGSYFIERSANGRDLHYKNFRLTGSQCSVSG